MLYEPNRIQAGQRVTRSVANTTSSKGISMPAVKPPFVPPLKSGNSSTAVVQGIWGTELLSSAAGYALNAGTLVGGAAGSLAGQYLGAKGAAVAGAIAGGTAGMLTGGIGGALTGAVTGGVAGYASGSAGGISKMYNTAQKYIPYLSDAVSIASAGSAAYFTVTALPVATPLIITYVAGGVTYSVTEHITGTILDIVSHGGEFPTVPAAAKGLLISAMTGVAVASPSAALHMLFGSGGAGALSIASTGYAYGLPGLMKGRHTTLKSRVGNWQMPHEPSETALAFGMDNRKMNLDYKNWARNHGAVTYRYFFTLHLTDWTSTLERITEKADKIYVNIGGYTPKGISKNREKPTIEDIIKSVDFYLREKTYGGKGKKIPAHGFTNFEIAFLIQNHDRLQGKLVWWNNNKMTDSPLISGSIDDGNNDTVIDI